MLDVASGRKETCAEHLKLHNALTLFNRRRRQWRDWPAVEISMRLITWWLPADTSIGWQWWSLYPSLYHPSFHFLSTSHAGVSTLVVAIRAWVSDCLAHSSLHLQDDVAATTKALPSMPMRDRRSKLKKPY